MRVNRILAIVVLVFLVLVGAGLAFDHRFIPLVTLNNNPLFVALVYCPTVFFAVFTMFKLRRGQLWPLTGFALGLIGTGLFHQSVAADTYGNPGYMVPIGHFAAPFVSMAAYTVSLIGAWAIAKALRSKQDTNTEGNENEKGESEPRHPAS